MLNFLLDVLIAPGETVETVLEAVTDAAETTASSVGSMMNNGMTLAEKAFNAGEMVLRGMGTVFIALIIIWGILELFNVIFHKSKTKETPVEKVEAAAVVEAVPEVEETSDDTELVAVIAAAVAAYTSTPVSSFRVVSFKRASKSVGWMKTDAE